MHRRHNRRCRLQFDAQLQVLKASLPAMIRVYPYTKPLSISKGFTMSNFIKALLPSFKSQKDMDEAYLALASNVSDLEARKVAIEVRNLWTSHGGLPA